MKGSFTPFPDMLQQPDPAMFHVPPPIRLRALLAAAVALLVMAMAILPASAMEVIESFHADIDVSKSGRMTVTETIGVMSEGNRIRRGIYRDFPLTFVGDDGAMHRVDFDIVRIERDGNIEDYKTEAIDNGIRIYIGKEDVILPSGRHTFRIVYETGRQIRYFAKHDELFWNVTGNGWEFPIYIASATVKLPEGVKPEATVFYTGPFGATEKNARACMTG